MNSRRARLQVSVVPDDVSRFVQGSIVFLLAAHLTALFVAALTGHDTMLGLVPLFDLSQERNVPTLVSTLLILANALLCGLHWACGKQHGRPERHWLALAAVFAFIAVDEFSTIHERVMDLLQRYVNASGPLHFVWVVPYLTFAAAVCLASVPFLRRLPGKTRRGLCLAGALYVAGAAGVEMVTGWMFGSVLDNHNLQWVLLTTSEETLELCGMALCLRVLLSALHEERGPLVLNV